MEGASPPPPPAQGTGVTAKVDPSEVQRETMLNSLIATRVHTGRLSGMAVLGLIVLAWIGAEAHDANCYSKATVEALSRIGSDRESSTSDCLILPWNDPE
jgi:hypothetical protein